MAIRRKIPQPGNKRRDNGAVVNLVETGSLEAQARPRGAKTAIPAYVDVFRRRQIPAEDARSTQHGLLAIDRGTARGNSRRQAQARQLGTKAAILVRGPEPRALYAGKNLQVAGLANSQIEKIERDAASKGGACSQAQALGRDGQCAHGIHNQRPRASDIHSLLADRECSPGAKFEPKAWILCDGDARGQQTQRKKYGDHRY
ncbi:MAG: hypothetical protein AAF415_11045 [Pseudomonadota bacterium]